MRSIIIASLVLLTIFTGTRLSSNNDPYIELRGIAIAHAGVSKDGRLPPRVDQLHRMVRMHKTLKAKWSHESTKAIGYWKDLEVRANSKGRMTLWGTFVPNLEFMQTKEYQKLLRAHGDPGGYSRLVSVSVETVAQRGDNFVRLTAAAFVCDGNLTSGLFDTGDPKETYPHTEHFRHNVKLHFSTTHCLVKSS